jgi:hypothetical protein
MESRQTQCRQQYRCRPYRQPDRDERHLRLLWLFHYVLGGLLLLFGSAFIVHLTIGLLMIVGVLTPAEVLAPPIAGWVMGAAGIITIVLSWTLAALLFIAAWRLRNKRSWTFCFIVACMSCLFMPAGTVLGVFTILLLSRETVKAAFAQGRAAGSKGN